MDELELATLIDSKISNGVGGMDGEVSNARQDNLDRYYGELYGYEVQGESSVVTRDVMETIEWAMPSIMRSFAVGRNIISFKPAGAQDEMAAEQETEAVWDTYEDVAGFECTHTIIKSALLNPNSYVKAYFEEEEEIHKETYENLNEYELALLLDNDDIEVIGQEAKFLEDGTAVYDVQIQYTEDDGEICIDPCPEEEVIIDKDWNKLSLKDCPFTCHRRERAKSDLVAEGFDESKLDNIGTDQDGSFSDERVNRRIYSDENDGGDSDQDESRRTYWVEEVNMLVDFDGDGVSERRRIVKIGNEIFENEECESVDMVGFSSILMPHKHVNVSLAELVKDLQEIRTTIMRQLLNNLYKVNNPRTVITDDVNMDDILNNESNGFIRTNDINGLRTEPTTPIIGHVIPALEVLNNEKESRTGISKNAKGLDADVLKESTMGAYRDAIAQANERVELIIRVLAETGFKELFLKIHEVMQRHGKSKEMKVNGQWIPVNPREWKERKHTRAHVGLGFNNRQEKLGAAMAITQHQAQLKQVGSPIVTPMNEYAGAELIAEASGESVDKFFTNPQMIQPKQPQPDPNMIMIQAQKEIEMMKKDSKDKELFIKQNEAQWKQFKEQQELELKAAEEGRKRAEVELEYGQNVPGSIV